MPRATARCVKCGDRFEPCNLTYCGKDFCSSCREEPASAVVSARKESYEQYRRTGMHEDEAGRKSMEFASDIERTRRNRGK